MEVVNLISITLIILFYCFSTICEGGYFHIRMESGIKLKYEHTILTLMRSCVWGLFYLICKDWVLTVSMIFIFPFIHDGIYYVTRNKLNPAIYKKGFWDDSTSSTALLELKLPYRTTLFVVGFIITIISFCS